MRHLIVFLFILLLYSELSKSIHIISKEKISMSHIFHSTTNKYIEVPENLSLRKVVIFIRHGDRSQISKEIGNKFKEDEKLTDYWQGNMLTDDEIKKLLSVAETKIDNNSHNLRHNSSLLEQLYTGRDAQNFPYGMLTSMGMRQLCNLGRTLHSRYSSHKAFHELFSSTNYKQPHIYCRSTSICRTAMSLCSTLYGLLIGNIDENHSQPPLNSKPIIITRSKPHETLYPQADGPCEAITARRDEFFKNNFLTRSFPRFSEIETKMKLLFGFEENVNWLALKDVLSCWQLHNLPLPDEFTQEDMNHLTKLNGFIWGSLYGDKLLNKLAIGRFIRELIEDINAVNPSLQHTSLSGLSDSFDQNEIGSRDIGDGKKDVAPLANMMIYSGHDSTLVPLLCALGIYNDEWPPYASYIAIEIAEFIENEIICSNCEPSIYPSNRHTPQKLDRHSHTLWVRIVYNDKERLIDGSGASTTTMKGEVRVGGTWCPYDKFLEQLESVAMTPVDYARACREASQLGVESAITKQFLDEIKATIGTIDKH